MSSFPVGMAALNMAFTEVGLMRGVSLWIMVCSTGKYGRHVLPVLWTQRDLLTHLLHELVYVAHIPSGRRLDHQRAGFETRHVSAAFLVQQRVIRLLGVSGETRGFPLWLFRWLIADIERSSCL